MIIFRILLLIIAFSFLSNKIIAQRNKVFKLSEIENWDDFINRSEMKVEREIALHFHQLINDYRSKKRLNVLIWDDTLWLAARNHNLWMQKQNKLSHQQTLKNEFYSGKNPEERLLFVDSEYPRNKWNGENCLYIGGYSIPLNTSTEDVAKEIFNDWKKSTGHNQNMLKSSHISHGMSIFIDNKGKLWATDLFGM